MHVNEWLRQRELGDLALRLGPGHELHLALGESGIDPDTPQRIQVHFDLVPMADQRVEMRKAAAPPSAALGHLRRDAMANAQQTRKPGASRMLRQMHQQVVASCPQPPDERAFILELTPGAQPAPVATDTMQLRERGMALEHRRRVVIDERIDLE